MFYINEISFSIFLLCFFAYFLLLRLEYSRENPSKFKLFKSIYRNWVKSRLNEESLLIAVQALRNFIMANSTGYVDYFI